MTEIRAAIMFNILDDRGEPVLRLLSVMFPIEG